MTIIIVNIRKDSQEGHYAVDVLIDGESKTLFFGVDQSPLARSVAPVGSDYERFFARTSARRHLPGLILQFHRGEQLDFPIDLMEYAYASAQQRKANRAKMLADETREAVQEIVQRFNACRLSRIDVVPRLMVIIDSETVDVAIASLPPELRDFFLSWAREHCDEDAVSSPLGPTPNRDAALAAIREWMARNPP